MIGDEIGALFIRIGSDLTDLHTGIGPGGKADKELESFTGRVNAGLGNLLKFGAALGAIGIIGIAVGLGLAAKSASDFQAQMRLLVTQAGASNAEMQAMTKGVLDMAGSVGTGPEELAQGLYHIESAGFRGQKALDALRIAAEGAKVGNANLEDVTNALDAVLVAGVPEAQDMAGAMGELNAIVGAGDMRMQDLADAMGTGILASAKTFGLGLKDVGAALAVMGDNNIRGADAATKLRMAISLMGATTNKAAGALKHIGIGSTELADKMRSGGLVAALQDLQDHLKKSGLSATEQARILSEAFGGGKSAGTIMLLLQQLDRLKTKEGEISAGASGFQAAWANTQKNFTFQWNAATAAVEAAGVKIGAKLLPPLTDLFKNVIVPLVPKLADMASTFMDKAVPAVESFANWLGTLKPDFQKAFDIISTLKPYLIDIGAAWVAWNIALAVTKAIEMGTLAFQFVLGLIQIVRTVGLATAAQWLFNIALDANPIGLVVIAIAALVGALIWAYNNIGPVHDAINGLWGGLQQFGGWLAANFGPLMAGIGQLIADVFTGNWGRVGQDLQAIKDAWGGTESSGKAPTGGHPKGSQIQHFATGGIVPGPIGTPQFAIVHGGERVLTPEQQRQGGGGTTNVVVELTPARLNNPQDLLDALYALMSAAQTRRSRGAQGFLGSVG